MLTVWIATLVSVVGVSLISLVGIVFLAVNENKLKQIVFLLVSTAVGALFGDTFIHLLPETFAHGEDSRAGSLLVLAGILMFFVLEKFLRWHHHHTVEDEHTIHPMGYMNLVADAVHNGIDGLLIGASFLTSMQLGIATTVAVVLHEIPSEICRFGVLVHAGFSKTRALWLNLLSATVAILGAVAALLLGGESHGFVSTMQPLTAGGFIYVAGTDLLPELSHDVEPKKSVLQVLCMSVGVAIMYALTFLE